MNKFYFFVIGIILLTGTTTTQALDVTLDKTKIGVEVGDWFVHEVFQAYSIVDGVVQTSAESPGDFINSTVTGFVDDNVTISIEHNGIETIESTNMSDWLESSIIVTDWNYWEPYHHDRRAGGEDFKNNPSEWPDSVVLFDQNYTVEFIGSSFLTTFYQHVEWDDNKVLKHYQEISWNVFTGVADSTFLNHTYTESGIIIDQWIWEERLISQGLNPDVVSSTETQTVTVTITTSDETSVEQAVFPILWVPALLLVSRKRRK